MMPKAVLPSVRHQWNMSAYAIGYLGNFNYANEGCLILDDGTIWFIQPEMGGGAHLQYSDWLPAIGTVTPEGWTRWSGDHFADQSVTAHPTYGGWAAADQYYIWDAQLPSENDIGDIRLFATDGTYIYYDIAPWAPTFVSYQQGHRIYRLDPKTGLATWIAGASYTTYDALDSHNGKQAQMTSANGLGGFTCDRTYLYWYEYSTEKGERIRRMKLEDPYPVETIFVNGTVTGSIWDIQANGLPRQYQSDYVDYSGGYGGMGHDDTYLYFMNATDLARMSKEGGPVEYLLFGGYTAKEKSIAGAGGWPDTPWVWQYWSMSNPEGGPVVGFTYKGVPTLEGLYAFNQTSLKVVDNRLFFVNASSGNGSNFHNWYNPRFSYFNLDELAAKYEKDGPQVPNRENPQWETISNGTALWESNAGYNRVAPVSVYDYGYIEAARAGSEPLHNWPGTLWDFNPHAAPPWNKRLVFTHMETDQDNYNGWLVLNPNSVQISWGCSYLEEDASESQSQYSLSLQFTGDLLKGYSAAVDLSHAIAPEEVHLSEVNSG